MADTYGRLDTGRITGTAAVVPLSTEHYNVGEIRVQAGNGNTGTVYVGNATEQYYELAKGESIILPIGLLTQVYVKFSVAGDTVNWFAIR